MVLREYLVIFPHIYVLFLPKKKKLIIIFLFINETSWSHNVDRYYILETVGGCLKNIGLENIFRIFLWKNKNNWFFFNFFISQVKLQITLLKFWGFWILHPEISEFGFYPLKFRSVWILHLNVLKFTFYSLNFTSFWILLSKIWGCLDFTPPNFSG